MSLARFAYYALWIAPAVGLTLMAVIMMCRKLYRELPFFFAYCVFSVLRSLVLFLILHWQGEAYFYGYWTAEALSAALGFGVIHEVFSRVFERYQAIQGLGVLLFRWAAAVLVLVAVVAAAASPGSDESRLMASVLVLERSVHVIQVGLLLLLFAFSAYFRLSWRHYVFGIALGFGLFASVQLVAVAMRAHVGLISDYSWGFVKLASYNCAVVVWITYLLMPQPAEATAPPQLGQVESWNRALLQLLQR